MVAVAGMLIAAIVVAGFIATRPSPCCGDQVPFASIYREPLSRLDVVLTAGDGHAFAVIAQDPLLQRPDVLRDPAELSYRAQRPVWGYLTWAGSFGQAEATGWVLVVLTVLACGFACAVAAVFLLQRGRSAWWALLVPLIGFESLTELTPELFAVALLGTGLLLWRSDRRVVALIALSLATLTRETMLLGVGVLVLGAAPRLRIVARADSDGPRHWRSRSPSTRRGSRCCASTSATGPSIARATASGCREADCCAGSTMSSTPARSSGGSRSGSS